MVAEGGWLLVAAGVGGDGWKRERKGGGRQHKAGQQS